MANLDPGNAPNMGLSRAGAMRKSSRREFLARVALAGQAHSDRVHQVVIGLAVQEAFQGHQGSLVADPGFPAHAHRVATQPVNPVLPGP